MNEIYEPAEDSYLMSEALGAELPELLSKNPQLKLLEIGVGSGINLNIAKDAASVTIKLRDGGSKIIFLSDQTPVLKSATGTSDDLTVGSNVTVSGKPNQDGSISAESIQIRPVGFTDNNTR